jgi:hypothetical protein
VYPTQARGPIPAFQSYEEEAAWWGSHDTATAECAGVFTPVEVRSTLNFAKQLMFRVDDETDRELDRVAHERWMNKAALVRKFVTDWLRDSKQHAS